MTTRKSSKKIWLLVLAVVVLLAAGAVIRHKTLYHFGVVKPGVLYRSGTLSYPGLVWVNHKVGGLGAIVNLRAEREFGEGDWYAREKRFAAQRGIKFFDIPMEPDTPPTKEQVEEFLSIVNDPACQPVIVHCAQGVIRTSMMVSVFRSSVMGQSNEDIFNNLKLFGHTLERRPQVAAFIKDYDYFPSGNN